MPSLDLDRQAVRRQVERVLQSPGFSPVPSVAITRTAAQRKLRPVSRTSSLLPTLFNFIFEPFRSKSLLAYRDRHARLAGCVPLLYNHRHGAAGLDAARNLGVDLPDTC